MYLLSFSIFLYLYYMNHIISHITFINFMLKL
nr:MAG TPA: hypothetical protein [Caudoviricetes sp.]